MEDTTVRHKRMSAVRSTDNKIEVAFRKRLWRLGIRYRKYFKIGNCHPDIVITKYKIAIFCDGDFWHGHYEDGSQVKVNTKFWQDKIRRNKERDLENDIALRDAGWTVVRYWESDLKANLNRYALEILDLINNKS